MKTEQLVIPIEITLGEPLRGLAAGRVADKASRRIGALAADLGISGDIHVTVSGRDAAGVRPVTITVHGTALEYPRSLELQVLVWHRHRNMRTEAGSTGLPSWHDQLAAGAEETVNAVADLAGHAVAAGARALLGPEQVSAWLELAAIPPRYATLLKPVSALPKQIAMAAITPRDGIGDVLATMLDLSLRIGDHKRIARLLSALTDVTAADAAEHIVEAVRPHALEVRVEQGYLEEITTTGFDANPDIFPFVRDSLYTDLGLRLPSLSLIPDQDLEPRCFAIRINDITTAPVVGVPPGMCLVNAVSAQLATIAPVARSALNPGTGTEGAYAPAALRAELEQQGYTTWDPLGHLALTLAETARTHARGLIDRGVVSRELDRFTRLLPALARTSQEIISVNRLTRLLRSLLDERVPVRDLRGLLQPLVDHEVISGLPESDDELLILARRALGASITNRALRWRSIQAYLVDPALAADIVAAEDRTARQAGMSLVAALDAQLAALQPGAVPPVLLTTAQARLPVRDAIRSTWPRLTVLAHEDLDSMTNVGPIGRLSGTSS